MSDTGVPFFKHWIKKRISIEKQIIIIKLTCLRACNSEQNLQSLNHLMKDAVLYLFTGTGICSAH